MLPIAGPFLGARKSFRSILTGEDFGLGTFLKADEVVELSRTSGSAPFLFPEGPLLDQLPVRTAFTRDDGVLMLRVNMVELRPDADCDRAMTEIVYTKKNKEKGHVKTVTQETSSQLNSDGVVRWNQIFQFVTDAKLGAPTSETIAFALKSEKSSRPRSVSSRDAHSRHSSGSQQPPWTATVEVPLAGLLTQEKSAPSLTSTRSATSVGSEKVDVFTRRNQELINQLASIDLLQLAEAFRGSVLTHSNYIDYQKFEDTFSGQEATEWLRFWLFEKRMHCTSRHAEALGNTLMQNGTFVCATPGITAFSCDYILYRYLEVATVDSGSPSPRSSSPKLKPHDLLLRLPLEGTDSCNDESKLAHDLPTLYRCCAPTGRTVIATDSIIAPANGVQEVMKKKAAYSQGDVIEVVAVRGQRLGQCGTHPDLDRRLAPVFGAWERLPSSARAV